MMAVRISRRRLTNWAQNPKSQRSAGRRLGARRRERCRTRSCCFKRIFSARTARVPPVPRRTASLASRCTITKIAFFMDKQLAQHRNQEQGSRIAAAAHLNYEFAMYRRCCKSQKGRAEPCVAFSKPRHVVNQVNQDMPGGSPFPTPGNTPKSRQILVQLVHK